MENLLSIQGISERGSFSLTESNSARFSRSVAANIAEGFRKRTLSEYAGELSLPIAMLRGPETQVWIDFGIRLWLFCRARITNTLTTDTKR